MVSPDTAKGFAPCRILIVDDLIGNRELLELMLATEGFEIMMAAGGQEALDMVAQWSPDLILLDVMMPTMSGCEVATSIKNDPLTRTIPVIMVTAYDDPKAKLACLAAGAEDFLTKPVDRIELCMRVRNLLRLRAAIAESNRARIAAEVADKAKSQFLRAVTHELRTPLNAITGFTEILEIGVRGAVNPEQSKDLGRIKRASNYLLHLVDDVLTAARLEGARPLVPVLVPVNSVMEEVLGLCEVQAEAKKITVTLAPSPDKIVVIADRARFQQILLNLVVNTIEFCRNDGAIAISCDHDGTMARVRIAEAGAGERVADLARVSKPFVQIDLQAGPTSDQGIGLGLSMSRELARAMHGDVTLQGVQGAGSVFTLSLPIAPREPADDPGPLERRSVFAAPA